MAGGLIFQPGHRVLCDEGEAEGGDQVVDAVVDFRIHVIGAAGYHQNGTVLCPGLGDVCLGGLPQVVLISLVSCVCRLGRGGGLPLGDLKLVEKPLAGLPLEIPGAVQAEVRVQVADLFQSRDVGGQQLRVVGHHRAVVVVVADALVEIIGHTGVEDGVYPLLRQGHYMAVEQLGGVAHRVRGDGALSLEVELPAGLRGEDHLEVEAGEQFEPEGQILIHIQAEGDADPAPGTVPAALAVEGAELCVFIPHQVGVPGGLLTQGAGAAVA